jgi:hypothetical protein
MISRTVKVALCFLFLLNAACSSQLQRKPRNLEVTLRKKGETFLRHVEARKPEGLLPFFAKNGVAFGIDAEPTSLQQAEAELQKGGVLRAFFLEFADFLALGGERKLALKINKESSGQWIGNVTLAIHGNAAAEKHRLNSLTMDFALEGTEWKLMSIEYP